MQDAGKEDYLRPSEHIGLDWNIDYAKPWDTWSLAARTGNALHGNIQGFSNSYH